MSRVNLSCLVVLAACLAGTVTADLQPGSLWHVINSRSDLSLAAAAISYHPDLVLFLSNPETKITMLLPNDKAMAAAMDANNKWETIRKNIRANDVLFPSSQVLSNAATVRKQMWMVLNYHILKQGIEINSKLLVPGDYPTALALEGQDNYLTVFRKAGSTYITDMDQSVEAKVVEADLQAGRSVLHIIDAVLFPDTAPARAFPKISDAVGTIFANLMRNASSELFYDFSPVPLTIFSPSDGAINDWAKGQGLTLDALYKNTGMSAQLVRAHAIQGQALYANDLLALAAAKRFGLKSADGAEFMTGVTARKNPNGNWLQVQTSWDGVTAGDIMVGFSDAKVGAQATSMGVIRGVAGVGGSEAGSDVVSVVYAVDKVLL